MRSLGTIRTRVERLAAAVLSSPHTVFVCLEEGCTQCPACAFDLDTNTREAALAQALAQLPPGDPPPRLVAYVPSELTTCPRCGEALPV
jgi:uncharacterized protein (UPF0212 family)